MRKAMQTVAAQRLHGIGQDPTLVYRQPSMSSLSYTDIERTNSQVHVGRDPRNNVWSSSRKQLENRLGYNGALIGNNTRGIE